VSGDFIEVPDAQHEEIAHLIEVEIGGCGHIADVLCPCNPRLVPVQNLGSKPYFALACRHYEPQIARCAWARGGSRCSRTGAASECRWGTGPATAWRKSDGGRRRGHGVRQNHGAAYRHRGCLQSRDGTEAELGGGEIREGEGNGVIKDVRTRFPASRKPEASWRAPLLWRKQTKAISTKQTHTEETNQ
jgi:hypothetical protein